MNLCNHRDGPSPVSGEIPNLITMNGSRKQLSMFSESNSESRKRKKLVPTLEAKIIELNDLVNSGRSVLSILENDVACVAKLKLLILKRIAIHFAQIGQWEKSHDMLQEILTCEKKILDYKIRLSPIDYAETLYHLGIALEWMGNNESALELLNESLAIRRKMLGDHHLLVAMTQCGIGVVKGIMEDYKGAIASLQISKEIIQKASGCEDDVTSRMTKFQKVPIVTL